MSTRAMRIRWQQVYDDMRLDFEAMGTEGVLLSLAARSRCRHSKKGHCMLSGVNIHGQNLSPMRPCIHQCSMSVRGVF